MNTNMIHNILNMAIVALVASMIASGCTPDATGLVAECSKSFIPEPIAKWLILGAGAGKMLINVFRDGFTGLVKEQPPVK